MNPKLNPWACLISAGATMIQLAISDCNDQHSFIISIEMDHNVGCVSVHSDSFFDAKREF
jgi:hypothetical protein